MGDNSIGLSSALDTFFGAARSLSVDPASTIMRTSFLKSTEGVGSRFAELSGQLGLVADETHQALQTAADQVNTLTDQLALVNQQLVRSPTLDGQPPELMDKRDLLLRQLSEFSRIKTSFTSNGIVSVSLSSTMKQSVVVDGIKSRPIGLDPASGSKFDMVVDPYGNTEPLSGASGGTIGGLHAFISQVLEPAQKGLDMMADNFVKEVNGVQTAGIDGYGNPGQALFSFNPSASSVAGGIQVALEDPMLVAAAAQRAQARQRAQLPWQLAAQRVARQGEHAQVRQRAHLARQALQRVAVQQQHAQRAQRTVSAQGAAERARSEWAAGGCGRARPARSRRRRAAAAGSETLETLQPSRAGAVGTRGGEAGVW
jgi:flagellar hook-associated protein FlgK